jgi:hypothetical protein
VWVHSVLDGSFQDGKTHILANIGFELSLVLIVIMLNLT